MTALKFLRHYRPVWVDHAAVRIKEHREAIRFADQHFREAAPSLQRAHGLSVAPINFVAASVHVQEVARTAGVASDYQAVLRGIREPFQRIR